ncbi:MAG: ribonuclease P protein component [Chitinophagales bacterium]|nr:ribonuclease P protein component [Chitinophagales bacterium]MDW8418293.1 ribonuclease P protein component [Chitinophagales bacterium]
MAGSCTFCKEEKLRSKKLIDKIFAEGKSVSHAGFALYYYTTPLLTRYPMQAAFAVPKRYHRLAVNRNRIKRLMREVWRKNKMPLYMALAARQTQAAVMWMYRGKSIPDYVTCEQRMLSLIHKLQNALT